MAESIELAMFPLGSVLFPTQALPLRIFEPRYRQMVQELLAGDGRFGVVLIEKGFEVGGGDVRTDIGTLAQIVQCQPYPDGRFALLAIGMQRLRVASWLPDDPYPKALVELIDEPEPDPASDLHEAVRDAASAMRRCLALASELGARTAPAGFELSDEPLAASMQLCAIAPLGPFDRQRLLVCATTGERLAAVRALAAEAIELFEAQLAFGAPPDDPAR